MASSLKHKIYPELDRASHQDVLVKYLDMAIEPEELVKLKRLGMGALINGGYVRNLRVASGRVASYNNTRKDESEIIAWIERARMLYLTEEGNDAQTGVS